MNILVSVLVGVSGFQCSTFEDCIVGHWSLTNRKIP